MKIGIFGGSFNPPHNMHLLIAQKLLKKQIIDKIIFVPTGIHYKYKNNLLPNTIRYDMVNLMIKNYKKMEISDFEFKEKVIHTYETLSYFQKKYKEDEIYFICGTDNWQYLKSWYRGKDIVKNYKIIIIRRNNNEILIPEELKKYQNNLVITDIEIKNLSSTEIRDKIKNNEKINDFLDSKVIEYIHKNNLYKEWNYEKAKECFY